MSEEEEAPGTEKAALVAKEVRLHTFVYIFLLGVQQAVAIN